MDWIDLAQDMKKVAGTCKLHNETLGSLNVGNFLTS